MIDLFLTIVFSFTRFVAGAVILGVLWWLWCINVAAGLTLTLALSAYLLADKYRPSVHDVRDVADYDGGENNY